MIVQCYLPVFQALLRVFNKTRYYLKVLLILSCHEKYLLSSGLFPIAVLARCMSSENLLYQCQHDYLITTKYKSLKGRFPYGQNGQRDTQLCHCYNGYNVLNIWVEPSLIGTEL